MIPKHMLTHALQNTKGVSKLLREIHTSPTWSQVNQLRSVAASLNRFIVFAEREIRTRRQEDDR